MLDSQKYIIVKKARENNLQELSVKIPKNKFIVMTGVSGSGKSSLAFKTIYEEGRRRYMDSLSSYARQFLGNSKKPDVESIEGLSPAISIEQKTTHNNPRSTVGTITEIHDYLRLLFARIGRPFCPNHKIEITGQKIKDIFASILKNKKDSRLIISAPVVKSARGSHTILLKKLKAEGFLRVSIDGDVYHLDDNIDLVKNKRHNINVIIDRVVLKPDNHSRIFDAVEIALVHGNGLISVENVSLKKTTIYSKNHACTFDDFTIPKITPRLFSFNAPDGMCRTCKGLGVKLKIDKNILMPDMEKSINQGGIVFLEKYVGTPHYLWQMFNALFRHYKIPLDKPLEDLSKKDLKIILTGSGEEVISHRIHSQSGNIHDRIQVIEGVGSYIERMFLETTSDQVRKYYKRYMSNRNCDTCKGLRLNQYALSIKINEKDISQFSSLAINDALKFVEKLELDKEEKEISQLIRKELISRLSFLKNVGLDYLDLNRKAETLSGGEAQRIRLATQIGSNLTGVLYVLDEPSIGLHQKDNAQLIKTLKRMRDIGNTLIVVEHDDETIRSADWIIDIGPGAGKQGGKLVAEGTIEAIKACKESITGRFLRFEETISIPTHRRSGNGKVLEITGISENNLKNLTVKIPLGKFNVVTGVSGSGKSTLVNTVITKAIIKNLTNPHVKPGKFKKIKGINNIDKIVRISQSPIGRTPRSNPATYTSVFNDIRTVFASTMEAKERAYNIGRFSFNVKGGRCDKCRGDGSIKIEMHFLPNVYVVCNHCDGARYNYETLEVRFKGKNIADILRMTVSEALVFFTNNPKIRKKLQIIKDVGLGYILLGQSAVTLSGGEAQRVKLATHLQKKPTGKTLYVLDEPTTGLHAYDVKKLSKILNNLVDNGDTILVIEHNLDIIKQADYIIDLGPGGGIHGGKIIAKGSPEQVAKIKGSYTAKYLKEILDETNK